MEKEVHKVQLLDVATGTGTFIAEVVKQIYNGHFQNQQGMWSDYVEQHLLPRLHGFEILMASYAMCHMKIELLLDETGYKPKDSKKPPRLGVYLTNSLEEAHPDAHTLFASWLSAEANEASRIKKETPVMVAFGNPPYSGHSANKTALSDKLLADYKKEPTGGRLKERNPKWLNDDYVKFIRIGEHYIERNGEGILAYITNHGYLDNPTFRGMRWHLLNTFDDIYIVDLHGNAKKKEVSPDGNADKNVFDIQQGVAIIIAVKHGKRKEKLARVHHLDMWGSRPTKYEHLWKEIIQNGAFSKITPSAPNYLFVPRNYELLEDYNAGFSVSALFPINSLGIQTHRDAFVINENQEKLREIFRTFFNQDKSHSEIQQLFQLNETKDWNVQEARIGKFDPARIVPIDYRPFDTQYIYLDSSVVDRSRPKVFTTPSIPNLYLTCSRQQSTYDFQHVFISKWIGESCLVSLQTKEQGYFFPLYLYPADDDQHTLDGKSQRVPNLDKKIVAEIGKKLGMPFVSDHENKKADGKAAFSPLDLLDYIYAVLHSPGYRETYKEFLKIDFPRIPYPDNAKAFWQLVALGRDIRLLHLLESPILAKPITSYPVGGDNKVEKPEYKGGKVYINKEQYFEGVPQVAWDFYIGGYQPAQKWLKDRKGRVLNFDDIAHYQKVIIALAETDRLMEEIDAIWKP